VTPTAPLRRVKRIQPHEPDRLHEPTMLELHRAEYAALQRGDLGRANAYRIVRARRLGRAQREASRS
jgi:hypothetical protein